MTLKRLYRYSSRRFTHLELRARQATHDMESWLRAPTPHRHNPYQVLHVDPRRVTHLMGARLPPRLAGTLLGGDWDIDVVPLSDTTLHRALCQRFLEQLDWSDTDLHPARYTRQCENEPSKYAVYTEAEFLRRAQALDRLYQRLATEGYLSHRQRGEPSAMEMTVSVTRKGTYARHAGGMHRLIIAQLLGLSEVPLRVSVVHAACLDTAHDPFRGQRPVASGSDGHRRHP